jgi:hypothetical protein
MWWAHECASYRKRKRPSHLQVAHSEYYSVLSARMTQVFKAQCQLLVQPTSTLQIHLTLLVRYVYWFHIITGFRLDIGFIGYLHTRLGTTCNYSAIANLHNSQITIAAAKPFPACCLHQPFSGSRFQQWTFFSFKRSSLLWTRLPPNWLFSLQTPVQN